MASATWYLRNGGPKTSLPKNTNSPESGSTLGWAVIGDASPPSKSKTLARSRPGESEWGNPDSTSARVCPPWRMTWVLAGPSSGSAGPLGGGVPCVEARALVLTQRLRYPVAFPPASEIAWIIPSPANQWYLVSSDGTSAGFGPFRSNCPSRSGGTTPLTSSSWSSVRSTCTGAKFPSRYGLGNAGSSPWGPTGPDGRGTDRSVTIPVTSGDVDERSDRAGTPTWQAESMADLVADLRFRGLIHQMTDPTLGDRLDAGSLTAYTGFDPTADSLHVGHLLQVCTLRRLQSAGHRPIAVAGGGTGFVGDPGGKSEERTLLDDETLEANLDGIRAQLSRFIDLGTGDHDGRALLVNNADWLRPLGLFEFLRDVGKHFTVNQMVAKDSVRSRLERADQGISYTEFSYMLLQAYDFLHLFDAFGCRLQVGGSDQWGNITMGIELVRKIHQDQVWGMTTPLVLKADGTKFGKTETGTVWLDAGRTSPYQLYQFFLRSEDAVVGSYLRFFTFLPHEALLELDRSTAERPERRDAQRQLAREVCTLVHGSGETARAEEAAEALFGDGVTGLDERTLLDVFAEAPSTAVSRTLLDHGRLPLVDLLVDTGLETSKTRARSTVEGGGAYVNNRRERDPDRTIGVGDLVAGRYVILRRGKRDYHLVSFG